MALQSSSDIVFTNDCNVFRYRGSPLYRRSRKIRRCRRRERSSGRTCSLRKYTRLCLLGRWYITCSVCTYVYILYICILHVVFVNMCIYIVHLDITCSVCTYVYCMSILSHCNLFYFIIRFLFIFVFVFYYLTTPITTMCFCSQ